TLTLTPPAGDYSIQIADDADLAWFQHGAPQTRPPVDCSQTTAPAGQAVSTYAFYVRDAPPPPPAPVVAPRPATCRDDAASHLRRATVRRARIETILLIPFAIGVLLAYAHRHRLFPGLGTEVQVVTVVALVGIGWGLARAVGRVLGPSLFKRMDPATAGTVGFLIRLVTMVVALRVALRIAGLRPRELARGR